ncbi:MAG: hypothetical protein KDK71_03130 [Chlamydiia bacterium]|nr:hypothetical protein [Chlamydiia bacterium]
MAISITDSSNDFVETDLTDWEKGSYHLMINSFKSPEEIRTILKTHQAALEELKNSSSGWKRESLYCYGAILIVAFIAGIKDGRSSTDTAYYFYPLKILSFCVLCIYFCTRWFRIAQTYSRLEHKTACYINLLHETTKNHRQI